MDVMPLLHEAMAADAKGEGGEIGSVHASSIDLTNPPEVAIDHWADLVFHLMDFVNSHVTKQAQRLAHTCNLFNFVTTIQVQGVMAHALDGILDILKQAPSMTNECDITDAKTAVLRDGHLVTLCV